MDKEALKIMSQKVNNTDTETLVEWVEEMKYQLKKFKDLLNDMEDTEKETWDKKIDAHEKLETQIKSELNKRGLSDEKIKEKIKIVELAFEKIDEEYKKAKREGLSDEEARARAERVGPVMRKMINEK